MILDKETEEQPILLEKINEKLNLDQISLEQKIIIRKELKKYPKQIEQIVKNYYEKINPIYSKEELIKDYLLLACIYILQINKYSYTIKKKFTQSLSENCFSDISFENYDVHELLFNDTYFLEFTKLPIIINRNLINNYAIYEFISQQLFLFPLILDPVGLFCSCFRMKNKDGKWMIDLGHLDSKSQELIEEACEKGRKLIIKDFDAGLLALIMPILVWRKEKVMRKIMDIIYLNNSQNLENEEIDENNLLDLNGKTIKIHPNFQLILIISDSSKFLSQSLLENVVIINNDIGDKEIWNETLLNLIVKKCSYKEENNKIMDQLLEGKSKNKLMIEYKKLLNLLKNLNMIDLSLNVNF